MMQVSINEDRFEDKSGLESNNFLPRSLKLEAEVDRVLQDFRKSQEFEYKVVEETIRTQKTYLQNLYQQLDYEKNAWVGQISSASEVSPSSVVRERKKQIRREVVKFEIMKKVANGFGKTSSSILKEHFGFKVID